MEHILVIRLSALGDVVRCFGAMQAIRSFHPHTHITWMTTKAFASLGEGSPYFDDVWVVEKLKWWNLARWFAIRSRLRNYQIVYDLQRNDRTALLRQLAPLRLQRHWMRTQPPLDNMLDTRALMDFPIPDASWLGEDSSITVKKPYMLLVPGSAPQHTNKRWPASSYIAVAGQAVAQGITPVVIGSAAERAVINEIKANVAQLIDLSGRTSFGDIAALARNAVGAIGNDTGPMHIIALAGCPCVSLFSGVTEPSKSAPIGKTVVLREQVIDDIPVAEVWKNFLLIKRHPNAPVAAAQ